MKIKRMRAMIAVLIALVLALTSTGAFASSDDDYFYFRYHMDGDEQTIVSYVGTPPDRLYIPYGVTAIADGVFDHCQNITKVSFPLTVKNIGAKAFFECSQIQALEFPWELETVGSQAFAYCGSLQAMEIYPGIESFASDALYGDLNLQMIVFYGTKEEWDATHVVLPSDNTAVVGDGFSINYHPWDHTAQLQAPEINIASAPLEGVERLDLTLGQEQLGSSDSLVLSGITASVNKDNAVTVGDLLGNLSSRGYLQVQRGDPGWLIRHIILATGDELVLSQGPDGQDPLKRAMIAVKGDVLGTGVLDIAQLSRVAEAILGTAPLEGIYELAADFNENGSVDIVDLVSMAEMLLEGES